MEIVRELREIPNLSLALGFFDGVHLGHQSVIGYAVKAANAYHCKSAVVTFKEHPYCFFKGESPKYILTLEDKYKCIEALGVDYLIELDFGSICNMLPIQYMENVLVKYFKPKAISTGFNHHFGVNKSGNVIFLSECQDRFGYTYVATPPQAVFGDIVSSTAIRSFIKTGIMDMATSMLGKKFSVEGTVNEGRGLGRTIGYPTANLFYPLDIIEPPFGVYDVEVILDDGSVHRGLCNFGTAPTVSDQDIPLLEVFILGFDGNLYGKDIKLNFNRLLRHEIKFDNIDSLKTQIDLDIQSMY